MRNAFVKTIHVLGKDPRVMLLIADTGQYIMQDFKHDYPERFLNVGVAEANLAGVAAGLAASGKIPFIYSIAPFYTRCLDQIRVDICQHELPIKIVAVGAGIAYGTMGPTHHAIEDIAIMRALPGMTVISPSDPIETTKATEAAFKIDGPVYLRLALAGETELHTRDYDYQLGKADILKEGRDIALFSTGRMVEVAIWAAKIIERGNPMLSVRVINIHTLKPIDKEAILAVAREARAILTVEEHNIIGGLGSAVAEVLAENNFHIPFKRLGINDQFCSHYGSFSYLQDRLKISDLWVANEALALLERSK